MSFQISNFSGGGGACRQTPLPKEALRPLVNTVAYSTQTGCLLQTLLKPLVHISVIRKSTMGNMVNNWTAWKLWLDLGGQNSPVKMTGKSKVIILDSLNTCTWHWWSFGLSNEFSETTRNISTGEVNFQKNGCKVLQCQANCELVKSI